MKASQKRLSCEDVRLDLLLFGDEESLEVQEFAEHVESCPHCQDRLSKTAAADSDWTEVCSRLRPDETQDGAKRQSTRTGNLSFLAPPSHPEMLGRLGRYEIEQMIGAGGMGIVLKGFDTELNRPVAIKVLAPYLAHSGAARQRFAREAKAAAAVVHEHVVAIHNVESEQEVPFLVMQYVSGWSLQDRVETEGPLATRELLRIGMQAAAGLAAAHTQGLIHRDVKPANILLEKGVERALLTDFGLARAADDASLTRSGIVAGTPNYMSPEQARGEPANARSDLFSLGAVLYFMATGHPPFRAEQAMGVLHRICNDPHRPLSETNANIPDELEDLIDRLLEKEPKRRCTSADEVQQELAAMLVDIQQPRRRRPIRRFLRSRDRRLQLMLAGIVLFAIAGFGWLADWITRTSSDRDNATSRTTAVANSADADPIDRTVLQSQQAELLNELRGIQASLDWMMRSPYPETMVLNFANRSWAAELNTIHVEVARIENSW